MKKVAQKKSKILLLFTFLVGFLVISAAFLFWLYNFKPTKAKLFIFQKANLPIAKMENHLIGFNNFWQYKQAAGEFSNDPDSTLLAKFFENEKKKLLAKKFDVNVPKSELEKAKSENQNMEKLGITTEFFNNEVLYGNMLSTKLQIWYNSQREYHQTEYLQLESYLQKIKSGESFGLLASSYSQDEGTKMLGGDAGYVKPSDLLEEIQNQIVNMQPGEVKIVPSRLGLHLIKLADKNTSQNDTEKWRLYQIFINLAGFESWLKTEASKIHVRQFIRL